MRISWPEYRLNLEALYNIVDNITDFHDGIVADEEGLTIVEKIPFTPQIVDQIEDYLASLSEETETEKFNKSALFNENFELIRNEILTKSFNDLSPTEKKIWMGLPLDPEDKEWIMTYEKSESIISKFLNLFKINKS